MSTRQPKEKMVVLLTGSAGYLAQFITEALLADINVGAQGGADLSIDLYASYRSPDPSVVAEAEPWRPDKVEVEPEPPGKIPHWIIPERRIPLDITDECKIEPMYCMIIQSFKPILYKKVNNTL